MTDFLVPDQTGGLPTVRMPAWTLIYGGRDISRIINPDVISVMYTDHFAGESDTLELSLDNAEDAQGRRRWMETWFPEKGDVVQLSLGYANEPLISAGSFQVDEPTFTGKPDVLTIKALGASVTPNLRTRQNVAYEEQSLAQIVAAIAAKHNLTVVGVIRPIKVVRVTQQAERDLQFLKRLGEKYGYVFSVKGTQLVFHERSTLESARVVRVIDRTDCKGYTLKAVASGVYKSAEVSYHDPATQELLKATSTDKRILKGDVLRRFIRVENAADAQHQADALLQGANGSQSEGVFELEGDPRCVAGAGITATGFGTTLGGKYLIHGATHRLTKAAGYTSTIEVKRAGLI